jgi:uncharacterized protein (TIGR01244 family)
MLPSTLLILFFVSQSPEKYPLPGATNTTRVDAVVMCGGATTREAFPELKKQGFVSVINLRQPDEPGADVPAAREAAEAAGLKYVHIPVHRSAPEAASVDAFLAAVTNKANQPMYIHCASANRVAAMWMIKRILVDGWEIPRATEEARAIGLTSEPLRQFAVDYVTTKRGK